MDALTTQKLDKVINTPLTDETIRNHLGKNAKIIKFSEFKNYNTIDDLLHGEKDYAIILIEQRLNSGHWCSLTKNFNKINWFDPYGYTPSNDLSWNDKSTNIELDQNPRYLLDLLDTSPYPVLYNDVKYQRDGDHINDCGRHSIFFIVNNVDYDRSLSEYYDFMKYLKETYKLTYDQIVSIMVE